MNHTISLRSILFRVAAVGALAALAVPAASTAADTSGFLYGRVITSNDTYEGRLRWDDEEAFWGDLFNGAKDDLPYVDEAPRRARKREPLRVFGITIGSRAGRWSTGRQAVVRFGDLEAIEPHRGDHATLFLKGGSTLELDGGSNDIGADIVVWDRSRGRISIDWDRIDRIELLPTPGDLQVDATRLQGIVKTDAGTFEGFVQWDSEECLSTDILDGESDDGDLEIPMGNIRRIERRSRSSSIVTLNDGHEMTLSGTNDVNHSIRGILVEDPRWGRVEVSWDAFESFEARDPSSSGPAYETFEPSSALHGTVRTAHGDEHRGQIVFDLDEVETWEMLNGDYRDVAYNIPFAMIQSIEPVGSHASRVTLTSDLSVELEDSVDVGDDNAGILILDGSRSTYVAWDDIDRITFDH